MSSAFVFPGQGSQSVGMLADFTAEPVVRTAFEEASGALGYDLWQLTQDGPAERLNTTEYTQPAMLVAGVALWRLWRAQGGPAPTRVSGHSLGEFSALVCAGALELATAADLVRHRGQLMQEAVPEGTGAMAAVLGLEDEAVIAVCGEAAPADQASGDKAPGTDAMVVEAVNFNSPGQVVIAGSRAAVERAMELAKARGAKRAVLLPVSVPSHSSLMLPAARHLAEKLARVTLVAPAIEYVSAVDARVHSDPQDIRELLVRQLHSPVRWQQCVAVLAEGVSRIIECGPGKVLTALNKRIARRDGLSMLALEDRVSLAAALAATQAATLATGA